jgi:hypothetical protein
MSVYPSVCQSIRMERHGSRRKDFPWNLICEHFSKVCHKM